MGNYIEKIYNDDKKDGKQLLGEGKFGKVYLDLNTKKVTKYVKITKDEIVMPEIRSVNSQGWNELVVLNKLNSICSYEESLYFQELVGYSVGHSNGKFAKVMNLNEVDVELLMYARELNNSAWVLEIVTENAGRKPILDNFNSMSLADKLYLLWEMIQILIVLKKHGIVHNDVHIGNILMNERVNVQSKLVLIDFGQAIVDNNKSLLENNSDLGQVISGLSGNGSELAQLFRSNKIALNPSHYQKVYKNIGNQDQNNEIKRVMKIVTGKDNPFEVDVEGVIVELGRNVIDNYVRLKYPEVFKKTIFKNEDVKLPKPLLPVEIILDFYENWGDSLEEHKERIFNRIQDLKMKEMK